MELPLFVTQFPRRGETKQMENAIEGISEEPSRLPNKKSILDNSWIIDYCEKG